MTQFSDFGLVEPLQKALAAEGYTVPTPIQTQTIPIALSGRDIIGIAQTGTGKTAAFALPILQKLFLNRTKPFPKSCRVLVLSPTRELSSQINDSFKAYGAGMKITTTVAIGGVPIGRQQRALAQGVDVLVATPGRLLDLVQSRSLTLNHIDTLVLDEADRMLDMGFIHTIRKIISLLPKQRQTLFFSATMPPEISELAAKMLHDPQTVAVTPVASTVEKVAQRVIHVDRASKPALLAETLKEESINRAIVFTRTKHGADKVVRALGNVRIESEAIHGNKSQNNRERTLAAFRAGEIRVLVATDIAARGIDVDGISHVFNYDLPEVPETYVHRIGRTARAGTDGQAIAFCDQDERHLLRAIEKLIKITIPATGRVSMKSAQMIEPRAEGQAPARPYQPLRRDGGDRPHGGGRHGGRHSERSGERSNGGHHAGQAPISADLPIGAHDGEAVRSVFGERPAGAPRGGKPFGGKPFGGKPGGAKPFGGRPGGGRPGGRSGAGGGKGRSFGGPNRGPKSEARG